MSNSKLAIDDFIRFTSRTQGRDKIYRCLQYACRFLVWYAYKTNSKERLIEKLQNIETSMSLTRKGMRLGRFIDYIKTALESVHIRNTRMSVLFGLIAVCQSLFMLFDNLLLLNRYKIIKLQNAQQYTKYLNEVWLLWLSLALTRDWYEVNGLYKNNELMKSNKQTVVQKFRVFWNNKPLVIDTTKNLCDIYLPLSNLNFLSLHPGLQGLVGTISSVLGLLQLWDKQYQLPS